MTEWRWTTDDTASTVSSGFYYKTQRRGNMPTKKKVLLGKRCSFCRKHMDNYRIIKYGYNDLKLCNNCHNIFKMMIDETHVKNLEAVRRAYAWVSEHKNTIMQKPLKTTRVSEKPIETKRKKRKALSVY